MNPNYERSITTTLSSALQELGDVRNLSRDAAYTKATRRTPKATLLVYYNLDYVKHDLGDMERQDLMFPTRAP